MVSAASAEGYLRADLAVQKTQLDLSIYFFVGRYDYSANDDLSLAYFTQIRAPLKAHYTVQSSAHSPLFEGTLRDHGNLVREALDLTNRPADIALATAALDN